MRLLLSEAGVVVDLTEAISLDEVQALAERSAGEGAFLIRCAAALLGGPDIRLEELAEAPERAYGIAVEALRIARGH